MKLSLFGEKFTAHSGILELMDDLGQAMQGHKDFYMLGGGNPAHIPKINAIWQRRMQEVLKDTTEFEKMMANYDTPQGKQVFLEALAELLNREFNFQVTAKNIGITNGSQSAFFFLLNMLSGTCSDGKRRKILFPLMPEYIGYADQSIDERNFISYRSRIEIIDKHTFKYHINFAELKVDADIGAICVSRPTNPTGNVLTDQEIKRLSRIAEDANVPLLIDNAYGTPFPQIIFEDVLPVWNENIILSMSLSKIGLPSVRTGITIASEEIINKLGAINAIASLSTGSIGQVLTLPLIKSGEILTISHEIIKPFYYKKSCQALEWIKQAFPDDLDYAVHKSEGALFLWLWFKNLPITTKELYERLKKRDVLIIPGQYFFFGLPEAWEHSQECIRLTYSQADKDVKRGIEIIGDELKRLAG